MRRIVLTSLLFALGPATALAHGGNPAIAFLTTPSCTATVAQGDCYLIRWLDSDVPIITGTASVELFATRYSPPTFPAGTIPDDLESRSIKIVDGIREADKTNAWCWDTTGIDPGPYFIWSRMREPAIEMSIAIISWAPGSLTVVGPNDPQPGMTVYIDNPNSPFRFSDDKFNVTWCGRDAPSGGATVKLEATRNRNQNDNLLLLADGLPPSGEFEWNTRCLIEGDYAIRATITAPSGDAVVNWSRYFLLVTHPFAPRDAGGINEGCTPDSGVPPDEDAGVDAGVDGSGIMDKEPEDCGCHTTAPRSSSWAWLILAGIVFAGLYRRP